MNLFAWSHTLKSVKTGLAESYLSFQIYPSAVLANAASYVFLTWSSLTATGISVANNIVPDNMMRNDVIAVFIAEMAFL